MRATKIDGPRRKVELDAESGVRVGKRGDGRAEDLHAQVHRHGDSHACLPRLAAVQRRLGALGGLQHLQATLEVGSGRGRQRDAARRAHEERHAQPRFERSDTA
ncbi:MAG: hypothetical protein MUF16_29685 [Burkholderiaceae bacterium]|nr:hypothetical protein [Burkholderiaceae bacterium]